MVSKDLSGLAILGMGIQKVAVVFKLKQLLQLPQHTDIYKMVRERILMLAEIHGTTEIISKQLPVIE